MYKVVLDSNIIISATIFGGKPRAVLELALEGKIELAVSTEILQEIRTVLSGKKFQFPAPVINSIITEIEIIGEIVEPLITIKTIQKDPADNKILECAVAAGADLIVSGDVHLLELKVFQGIRIVNASDFLEII